MSRLTKALLVLLLGLPLQAVAQCVTTELTWTAPTKNEDGSNLTDLSGYKIYYGTNQNDLSQQINVTNAGLVSYCMPVLAPGTWYFRMTALAGTSPVRESERTNQVSKVVTAPPPDPNPPTDLKVVDGKVYTLVKQRDRMFFLEVGTVPPNTPCIVDQRANQYYAVPRASVTFAGSVRPEIVFATCL